MARSITPRASVSRTARHGSAATPSAPSATKRSGSTDGSSSVANDENGALRASSRRACARRSRRCGRSTSSATSGPRSGRGPRSTPSHASWTTSSATRRRTHEAQREPAHPGRVLLDELHERALVAGAERGEERRLVGALRLAALGGFHQVIFARRCPGGSSHDEGPGPVTQALRLGDSSNRSRRKRPARTRVPSNAKISRALTFLRQGLAPALDQGSVTEARSASGARGGTALRGRPAAWMSRSHSQRRWISCSISSDACAIALRAARVAVEAHRLAPRDRRRGEVAELPVLRAVDRTAHDRHALLQRDHRRARLHLARNAAQLPRPLDEDAEHAAVTHDLAHAAHGFAIRLAAPHTRTSRTRG